MPSNEERRLANMEKLDREIARRAAQSRKRKIIIGSVVTVVVLALAGSVTAAVLYKRYQDSFTNCSYSSRPDAASALQTKINERNKQIAALPAAQRPAAQAEVDAAAKQLTTLKTKSRDTAKPESRQKKLGTTQGSFVTSAGAITFELDRGTGAPCNVGAITTLINGGFYNNTTCHRAVISQALTVLQCGDPTATGSGGPKWTSPDEKPASTSLKSVMGAQGAPMSIYPRGTLAVANTGEENSGSSQIFMVDKDSQLIPDYAIVGKVDAAGLKVLDAIIKKGLVPFPGEPATAGPLSQGAPKEPVTIKSATVSSPS